MKKPRTSCRDRLTLERVREAISYDPKTGRFTRRGKRIGLSKRGYGEIQLDGVRVRSGHLAWFYVTGEWPSEEIDHRNNRPSDMRFDNLRPATSQQNKWNKPVHPTNQSKLKGAMFRKDGYWRSHIRVDGKLKHLGYFDSAKDAHAAYVAAAKRLHGDFARLE